MQDSWKVDQLAKAVDYFDTARPNLLEGLENAAHVQNLLCDILEQIADSIPAAIDSVLCGTVALELEPLIRSIHRFEETLLFPFSAGVPLAEETVLRLKREHFEDECFAEELTESLADLSRKQLPDNPEALGYMLRGFFGSVRRHTAFETDLLRSLILTPPAISAN